MVLKRIEAVVCDYGGVLTNPLIETLEHFAGAAGLTPDAILTAMGAAAERNGADPMALLEVGAITEADLVSQITAELPEGGWALPEGRTFGEAWFAGRTGNREFAEFLGRLGGDGYRIALLTNNVIEWEELWRATVPADDLFEVVVNSAHEGVRKPDAEIYERLLARLDLTPDRCLFVDDLEANLEPAARMGMATVRFRDNAQAIADVSALLDAAGEPRRAAEGVL
ncbi:MULTISPECIES: HAD family hydrolase [Nocardiopsidaceae]|uniref:HAD family phosphatase n=1 Tax=Streptomonospora nanhaiensis TaxID=1323731 RepID=A0ABY6YT32_9ACTN|nr:HAD family phosphatase [Streptomonospora nanhaiensis]WAE75400.1 HAD family phosphatase [Streptomonospora nanhaiensis]